MDKRILSRVDFKIEATLRHKEKDYLCEVKNLSLKGMFVSLNENIPEKEEVFVTLQLSTSNSDLAIHLNGTVVRITPDGIGIHFTGVELDSFIFLRNIMIYNSGNSDMIDKEYRDYIIWNSDKSGDIPL